MKKTVVYVICPLCKAKIIITHDRIIDLCPSCFNVSDLKNQERKVHEYETE